MIDRPLIIGIGQPWRGDDTAGLEALTLLADLAPRVDLQSHHGEGLGLIALWEGRRRVIVIDAALSGAAPGTLFRLTAADVLHGGAPGFRGSSHVVGLTEAIGTANALGRLPATMIVHAIEGSHFSLGAPLSAPVDAALDALAQAVRRDLL